jgi:hypothetical protein
VLTLKQEVLTLKQEVLTLKQEVLTLKQVQVAGQRHAAKVSLKPLYDPSALRVKA